MKNCSLLLTAFLLQSLVFGQQAEGLFSWKTIEESRIEFQPENRLIIPQHYSTIELDFDAVKFQLDAAPLRGSSKSAKSSVILNLPLPDGASADFYVMEAPVMAPQLAQKYPGIRSFSGVNVNNSRMTARFGYAENGFHAMIWTPEETIYIDPYAKGNTKDYIVYRKKDFHRKDAFEYRCETEIPDDVLPDTQIEDALLKGGDCQLRTYRLALACTGEYAQFHGGTKPLVLAEMNRAMTRINGIYERDFGLTMVLVPNNDLIIYLNANNDPYTNGSESTMLNQNQGACDSQIGAGNYDIGHVFGTGNGGIAGLRSVCVDGSKGRGVTALPNPVGDPFYVDYVAHEMGHSFGANHSFNNSCGGSRVLSAAMEPGSGSTIMSYAGICNPNVQGQVDDYFHAYNMVEIYANILNGPGSGCPVITPSGHTKPIATAPADKQLPVHTPFVLTGIGTDQEDPASLTFTWEQMDAEIAIMPPSPNSASGPLFRSVRPSTSPSRYFPNLSDLASGTNPTWEVVPGVDRLMKFRFSVRDNHPGAGCVDEDDLVLTFNSLADSFHVEVPNGGETWLVGNVETIRWDVANTDISPVSCGTVDILLSKDGGLTYPVTLATNVPNNGSYQMVVPNQVSADARVFIKCSSNYFFDISNQDFSIEEPPSPTFIFDVDAISQSVCNTENAVFDIVLNPLVGFNEMITLSVTNVPAGANAVFSQNPILPGVPFTLTFQNLGNVAAGSYMPQLGGTSASVNKSIDLMLRVYQGLPSRPSLTFPADGQINVTNDVVLTWANQVNTDEFFVELASNPGFGGTTLLAASTPENTFEVNGLQNNTVYYWRVKAQNACGESSLTPIFAFRTINPNCVVYRSTNVPIGIPTATPGNYSSVLQVPDNIDIIDANVYVRFDHSWMGDLQASISSPEGTSISLFDRPGVPADQFGCGQADMSVFFDDEAPNSAGDLETTCSDAGLYAIEGDFQPINPLSRVDGENGNGTWTLDFRDNASQDGGSLIEWYVELCKVVTPTATPNLVRNLTLSLQEGETKTIGKTLLEASSVGNNPDQIIFILRTLPAYGNLRLAGFALSAGEVFTQADINGGFLSYRHTGGNVSQTDGFIFEIFNAEGGWTAGNVFNISIMTNNLAGVATIVSQISCNNGSNGQILVNASGGTPPYQYRLNNGSFQSSNIFSGLSAGTYTITVRDASGFTNTTNSVTLTNPNPIILSANVNGDVITVNASGGTGTLMYSIDGTTFQSSNVFSGLSNGAYTVTVRDANGCLKTTSAIVAVNSLVVSANLVQNISCPGAGDGIIEVDAAGGNAPYTYSINGGNFQPNNRFENLGPGNYTITVKDNDGFEQSTNSILISNPDPIIASADVNDKEVTINASGGTGTLRYSLDGVNYQSGNNFSGLNNGGYTAYVRDENGCVRTVNFTISVNTLVVSLAIRDNISCYQSNNGSIEVSAGGGTPPYTFSIDGTNFQSSNIFQNLGPGTYTVVVKDSEGFVRITNAIQITEPQPLVATTIVNGYDIIVQPSGGTSPFQYTMDGVNYQSSNIFPGNASGTYAGIVRDANGCMAAFSAIVSVAPLGLQLQVTTAIRCFGDANGAITATGTGGIPPYQYSLDGTNYQSSNFFNDLRAGNYTIYVKDVGGFTTTSQIMLSGPAPLVINVSYQNGNLVTAASGGTGNLLYSFNDGPWQTDNILENVTPGEAIQVAVQDQNLCELSETETVPVVTLNSIQSAGISCFGALDGSLTINTLGGVPPLEFSLNNTNWQTSNTFSNLAGGSYTIYVRDAGGFNYSFSASVNEPTALTGTATVNNTTITVNANGGTPPFSYSLDGNTYQSSNVFLNVPNGNYTITVRDANGCEIGISTSVSSLTSLPVSLTFEISPNPSTGAVLLRMNQPTGRLLSIRIFDQAGKLMLDRMLEKTTLQLVHELNLDFLESGTYILTISDGKMMGRKQVVILR